MNQVKRLLTLAQELVADTPDFCEVKGPGAGDHATNAFMLKLRGHAHVEFGNDYAEQELCSANGFRVDYYFPSEATGSSKWRSDCRSPRPNSSEMS